MIHFLFLLNFNVLIVKKKTCMDKNDVDDFHFNTVIGRGTYAKVCLVTRKKDEKLFALKILKKKYIIEKNQEEHIMTEKQILA